MLDNTLNRLSSCFPHLLRGSESTVRLCERGLCVLKATEPSGCSGAVMNSCLLWTSDSITRLLSQTKCWLVREQTQWREEPATIALTCSAGGTVGRPTSSASLATVVARMALLLKFKLPWGAIQNAAAIIKNPGGKAGGESSSGWLFGRSQESEHVVCMLGYTDLVSLSQREMPGASHLRACEILVTDPSLAQDVDPSAGKPETGEGADRESASK